MSKAKVVVSNASQILAGLFKSGVQVYKASSRGGSAIIYKNASNVIPHRKGVRFKVAGGGSGFLMLEGSSIGTVCFKAAIPALSKLSAKTPSGFTLLSNCYSAKNAAELKTLLSNITKTPKKDEDKTKKTTVSKTTSTPASKTASPPAVIPAT